MTKARKEADNIPSPQEAPRAEKKAWYRKKKYQIGFVVVFVFLFSLTLGLALRNKGESGDWKNLSPGLQQIKTANLIKLAKDRTFVAGSVDNGDAFIEVFGLNDGELQDTIHFEHTQDAKLSIEALDVNKKGNRVAVALAIDRETVEFHIYSNIQGEFKLHGEVITTAALTDTAGYVENANVMLSTKGKTLGISYNQGSDGWVQVLTEVPSQATIGGVWKPVGETLTNLHDEDHGEFATFTAMDGKGTKLIVAGGEELLAIHELNEGHWNLTAELHEAPLEGTGSLSMSRDGSSWASGAYNEEGESRVQNNHWPDSEFLATKQPRTSVQLSLSEDGSRLLEGLYPLDGGEASFQLYFFYGNFENKWLKLGNEFGQEKIGSGQSGSVDLSDDGNTAAAIVNGRAVVYEYTGGEPEPFFGA